MKYLIYDAETQNHKKYKRVANQFIEDNWVIMRGWKIQGDARCSYSYHPEPDGKFLHIPEDITMIVCHNAKFDLLYEWDNPELKAFFKRGGRIWCTQYAEYLLTGQHQNAQMCSMDSIVEKYGGRKKIDGVKVLWQMGHLTSEIDKDMLVDYLIGTEEEKRNSGDIGNTELIFLGQVKLAKHQGMTKMILARMDSLLATTEMEYNGLHIDTVEAKRRTKILEDELEIAENNLKNYIPELPPELEFNWNSTIHRSSLIFGGTIKYKKSATYIDEKTGELARLVTTEKFPLFNGEPQDPACLEYDEEKGLWFDRLEVENQLYQDVYKSGKKKGDGKFKNVRVPGELKTKIQDFFVDLPGYTVPEPKWQGKQTDGDGAFIYSTASDVIDELGHRNIAFLKDLKKRQDITKDLGTYYITYDPKKKEHKGMLTCVMDNNIVHHMLNHTSTVTSRLSSSNPNLQNIPRADKSEVKKMFTSRFGGYMLEIDYSQLEVVVQGMLSQDINLCKDLNSKIDFHCKRVAAKLGCTYEEAVHNCKELEIPEWKVERTNCKNFSFQRAYGAGAPAIARETGMDVEEVKMLIESEEIMYPGVVAFNKMVEDQVKSTAKGFYDPTSGKTYRRGYYVAPTGTRYSFRTYDAPEWKKDGIDTFMPTELKNYPVQGTGGEIVQIILGKLWRHLVANNNYDGRVVMCNTVHDCVWFDIQEDMQYVAKELQEIMESVPEVLQELYGIEPLVPFPVEAEIGRDLYKTHVIH